MVHFVSAYLITFPDTGNSTNLSNFDRDSIKLFKSTIMDFDEPENQDECQEEENDVVYVSLPNSSSPQQNLPLS